jgi:hypothetical protein
MLWNVDIIPIIQTGSKNYQKISQIFCSCSIARTVVNVPSLMHPGYIQTISWYILVHSG